jgi:hypothetical protein
VIGSKHFACAAALGALMLAASAQAGPVWVPGTAGPWDPTVSDDYGIHDNTGPTTVPVTPGKTYTITYVSGLASAFGGVPPTVDALGYVGGPFGSGPGLTGIGSSNTFFPSWYIDPTNSGPGNIWLESLIGAWVDGSGAVIGTPFAPGDGPFLATAPAGAVALSLGANDDIFGDNSGGWWINVSVPEPSTWAMLMLGVFAIGAAARLRRRDEVIA